MTRGSRGLRGRERPADQPVVAMNFAPSIASVATI
jgi:hypothetical protein